MALRYRQLASDLRDAINRGDYPPGTTLPTIADLAAEHGMGKGTVSAAVALLESEGLVRPVQRTGIVVLDQRAVRVPSSRYAHVLAPGGDLGPWEHACAAQGISGEMVLLDVEHAEPPADVAGALGLGRIGPRCVCRSRHATIDGRPVQLHSAWYPSTVAAGTALAGDAKVVGGIYAALAEAGRRPVSADETVTVRPAGADEMAELHLRGGSVLVVERVTRDAGGKPLEFLRVVADPARTTLVYDGLPLDV